MQPVTEERRDVVRASAAKDELRRCIEDALQPIDLLLRDSRK
jgi:hypothetical protein